MDNENCVNVCFAADNGYSAHLASAIASLLTNTASDNINIYILDGGISEDNRQKILNLKKIRHCHIMFKTVDLKIFENAYLPENLYFTQTIYYRLMAASLFPELDKIVYLDSDVAVLGDISELYNIDISEYPFGAVEDCLSGAWLKRLNLPQEKYYCSGVLLVNLKMLREENYEQKFFDCIEKMNDKLTMPDQDVINIVCGHKILPLEIKWDISTANAPDSVDFKSSAKKVKTCVLHFIGMCKPWLYIGHYSYKLQYYKYLNLTDFATFKTKYLQWFINILSSIFCIYKDVGRTRYRIFGIKGKL